MTAHRLSKQFNPDLRDLKILHDHPDPSVNVLAVHGLAAHPVETWVAKEGKWNWLQHQLVNIIPEARVWTFGYDSTWCEDKSVDTRLSEVASKLLDAIDQNVPLRIMWHIEHLLIFTQDLSRAKLIFVAHSFGGIVVSKALLIAENRHNEWANNGKALNLFQLTEALVFFGTPFGGTDEWYQKYLPGLANDLVSHVDNGIFETFRRGNDNLNELKKNILDKLHSYKKPNVGCFHELQVSNVGKIVGDEKITKVVLVQREDAILADGPSSGEPRFLNRPLERNHFDMQKFEEKDRAFQTVESVLKRIVPSYLLHISSAKIVPSPLTPGDQEYLKSLSFPEMNNRLHEIRNPSSDTCAWLLKHQTFQVWMEQRTDLLCIKGKPGAGKSTLMKFAVEKETSQRPVLASFFFHARGTELQKTSLGLYRSLLHQILLQVPSIRPDFRQFYQKKDQAHETCTWHVHELQRLLTDFIMRAGKIVPIFIYIDALDECGPEEERYLTDYLQTLTDPQGSSADAFIKICFSCRHYPYINLHNCLEICAEEENEDDITTHVRAVFEAKYLKVATRTDITVIDEIRVDITKRSSNLFQWVFLILKIIDDMYVRREPWKLIRKKIHEVPRGLTDLYTHILSSMDEDDRPKTSNLLRWILLANRPLTPNELRIAMAFDTNTPYNSLKSWRESDEYYGNCSQWKERVTHLSAGLAEVVQSEEFNFDNQEDGVIVQFIHESVNDYLQKEGISMLGIKQAGSIIGQCHKQIARSCVFFIKCAEFYAGLSIMDIEDGDEDRWNPEAENGEEDESIFESEHETQDGSNCDDSLDDDAAFIGYAMDYWLWHSEQAENELCSLEDILDWFDYPSLKSFQQYLYLSEKYDDIGGLVSGSTYLHVASRANLPSLADVLLTRGWLKVDVQDSLGMTALYVASKRGNERMVQLLLRSGADVNARNGIRQATLAYDVDLAITEGPALNMSAKPSETALMVAVWRGHVAVVKQLLKGGADVNARGGETGEAHSGKYGTVLQAAAYIDRVTMMELLLENGAEVNAQGGKYGNALQAAAYNGHVTALKSLLKNGADINAQGGQYGNALQAASGCFVGVAAAKLLLENGAEVNAQGGPYGNALQAAAHYQHVAVVKLLLKHGADVNAQGGCFNNALRAGLSGLRRTQRIRPTQPVRHPPVVELLLKAGAKHTGIIY